MARLLFEKVDNAIWMSHLDLMRVFQRAFQRAGLPLKHTQGFNPRPSVSIALPMSVGVESVCELLDFDVTAENISCDEIKERLNKTLVRGVRVLNVYEQGMKIRELATLRVHISMEYDAGIPDDAVAKIQELFARDSLMVEKKSKNGIQMQDIIPMICSVEVSQTDGFNALLDAVICCQNPSLNPNQLVIAICNEIPECKPDFSKCRRIEIFDKNNVVFR